MAVIDDLRKTVDTPLFALPASPTSPSRRPATPRACRRPPRRARQARRDRPRHLQPRALRGRRTMTFEQVKELPALALNQSLVAGGKVTEGYEDLAHRGKGSSGGPHPEGHPGPASRRPRRPSRRPRVPSPRPARPPPTSSAPPRPPSPPAARRPSRSPPSSPTRSPRRPRRPRSRSPPPASAPARPPSAPPPRPARPPSRRTSSTEGRHAPAPARRPPRPEGHQEGRREGRRLTHRRPRRPRRRSAPTRRVGHAPGTRRVRTRSQSPGGRPSAGPALGSDPCRQPTPAALADAPVLAHVVRSGFVESAHRAAVAVTGPDGDAPRGVGRPPRPGPPALGDQAGPGARHAPRGARPAAGPPRPRVREPLCGAVPPRRCPRDARRRRPDRGRPAEHPRPARTTRSSATPGSPRAAPAGPLAQTCSGKHAAMLATCVVNGWPTETYRDPAHPLQQLVAQTLADLAGEPVAATVGRRLRRPGHGDLAGRPRPRLRPDRRRLTPGTPEARIADAMRAHPEIVGGTTGATSPRSCAARGAHRQGRRGGGLCRRPGRRPRHRREDRRRRRARPPRRPGRACCATSASSPRPTPRSRTPRSSATASRSAPSSPSASRRAAAREDRPPAGAPRGGARSRARPSGDRPAPACSRSSGSPTTTAPSRWPRRPARSPSCASSTTSARSSTWGPPCSSSASSPSTPTPARAAGPRGTRPRPAPVAEPLVEAVVARPARPRPRGGDGPLRGAHGRRAGRRRAGDHRPRRLSASGCPHAGPRPSSADAQSVLALILGVAALGVEVFALVDALRRRPDAFTAAGKLTKNFWSSSTVVASPLGVVDRSAVSVCSPSSASSRPASTSPTSSRPSTR